VADLDAGLFDTPPPLVDPNPSVATNSADFKLGREKCRLEAAGWDLMHQIREQYFFTKGRVMVRGKTVKRGERKFADYLLLYKSSNRLAVIEAKDNNHSIGSGMQQGLEYAERLDVPFVFSTNGDGFLFHNRLATSGPVEQELPLDGFPSPDELWQRYCQAKNLTPASLPIVTQDYHSDGSGRIPHYYQTVAINRAVEAIAKGQKRVLLVMATGTGKTFTAFQIIWRLWKSKAAKRILFLADRNILIDQTIVNDFKPFKGAMAKLSPKRKTIELADGRKETIETAMTKKRSVNKSYEIYLCLYQAVTGTEEEKNVYKQFSPDFFDLIVVDECHRGSAAEDSSWREVLTYFSSATHLGMTATPKETKEVSNITYFGDPVYTYSLKQGIEDGFLAPYKVVRIDIDKDVEGWRPPDGKTDKHGQLIEDRVYNQQDFDRELVLEKRTELVAKKITEFLKGTNRFDKTIVFCEDIDHAERMRQALVNENADLVAKNHKYVMRITGDNAEGKKELDQFIHPEEPYPVIVTTSELMTTGVDAKTCKLIVLDKRIQSMTKFKQIIGRGTRIDEDFGKMFFTIMDFKKATELFADPDFDGDPVVIYEPKEGESVVPPDVEGGDDTLPGSGEEGGDTDGEPEGGDDTGQDTGFGGGGGILVDPPIGGGKRRKYYVNDVPVAVVGERIQYYGNDGKLITESLTDYTRKTLRGEFASLDSFLQRWTTAEQKQAVLTELEQHGVFFNELAEQVGKDLDPFDLVCHVAFDQPPLTRRERADNVKKRNYFTKYGEQARAVLEVLLEKYADEGIEHIETMNVLRVQPLSKFGTPVEIVRLFGGKDKYEQAVRDLESALYALAE
jgi:type I restriction enzyme R subunit